MKHFLCSWGVEKAEFTCETAAHEFAKAIARYLGVRVTVYVLQLKMGEGTLRWVPTGHSYEVQDYGSKSC